VIAGIGYAGNHTEDVRVPPGLARLGEADRHRRPQVRRRRGPRNTPKTSVWDSF
jgi:hypothetical protein